MRADGIADLLLREANATDEQAVIEVVRAAMSTYSDWCADWLLPHDMEARERDRWRADDLVSHRIVAYMGERIVGVSVWMQAPTAVLSLFMVSPSVWGAGVASALHDRTLREATTPSSTVMRLTVPEGNRRARRFYERNRWQEKSVLPKIHPWLRLPMLEYERLLA